ncbi:hypothetical protein GOODEAATRI_017610 [Goodea atripinnis]|uniref:Uncharacterized protein n=1 Tax=Goodea atripinnis TaxID=208336 RepID=A0ABV0P5Q3_9TELE
MVPAICCSHRDEAEIHLAHLPVHRILWRTGPDQGNLISHIFRENDVCWDAEWERYFCFKNIEVPEVYSGPHLTFPLTVEQTVGLLEAFRNKKVGTW